MPPTPLAVGDIVQATIHSSAADQILLNVLHYRVTTAIGDTYVNQMEAIAEAIGNAVGSIGAQMVGMMSQDATLRGVDTQRVASTRSPFFRLTVDAPGIVNTPCPSPNVALSVTKRCVNSGRGFNGRFQLGGIPEGVASNGRFEAAYMTDAQTLATRLAAKLDVGIVNEALEPVIWRGPGHLAFRDIMQWIPQDTVRTMHRRTVGLGI